MTLDWTDVIEAEAPKAAFTPGALETKFLEPPFSVLDSRKGSWQTRRRAWLSLGIQSEVGRDDELLGGGLMGIGAKYRPGMKTMHGSSIFDPVLCELAYRWFAPPGGTVLDPFAGGSVRGIVAAKLGHPYTGIDLSERQVEANRQQAADILGAGESWPTWHRGDSSQMNTLLPQGEEYDFVWTCPPYFDLEVYSKDPADLSNMPWGQFMIAYDRIIELACLRLKANRFAGIVVSEVRGPDGGYRGLVPYTIHSFLRAGLKFYNEAVMINAGGTLPIRATRYMEEGGRKLGRSHQNVLIFLKGTCPKDWSYEREAPPSPQLALF
jgi:16S rRNA G966 N2-methylase RsmD